MGGHQLWVYRWGLPHGWLCMGPWTGIRLFTILSRFIIGKRDVGEIRHHDVPRLRQLASVVRQARSEIEGGASDGVGCA